MLYRYFKIGAILLITLTSFAFGESAPENRLYIKIDGLKNFEEKGKVLKLITRKFSFFPDTVTSFVDKEPSLRNLKGRHLYLTINFRIKSEISFVITLSEVREGKVIQLKKISKSEIARNEFLGYLEKGAILILQDLKLAVKK